MLAEKCAWRCVIIPEKVDGWKEKDSKDNVLFAYLHAKDSRVLLFLRMKKGGVKITIDSIIKLKNKWGENKRENHLYFKSLFFENNYNTMN